MVKPKYNLATQEPFYVGGEDDTAADGCLSWSDGTHPFDPFGVLAATNLEEARPSFLTVDPTPETNGDTASGAKRAQHPQPIGSTTIEDAANAVNLNPRASRKHEGSPSVGSDINGSLATGKTVQQEKAINESAFISPRAKIPKVQGPPTIQNLLAVTKPSGRA
jgi:hypothetical protein